MSNIYPPSPLQIIDAAFLALQGRALNNSRRWFPHLHDPEQTTEFERLKHMGLGLAEEAGEVAGVIKKITGYKAGQANHSNIDIDAYRDRLDSELIDVLVYLINIAADNGTDLLKAYLAKEETCNERWGHPQ